MARALAAVLDHDAFAVVVNVGDDDTVHGVHVAADLDTVMYTLAGIEGEHGWGRRNDAWSVMAEIERMGGDTSFRLGDLDLATCLLRTDALRNGRPLSAITANLCASHGVGPTVLPATDNELRTNVQIGTGEWLDFQEYFVRRRHQDPVAAVAYAGADAAEPAPGVIEAISAADIVIIAPSNPPLSIWPILAVPAIRDAVASAQVVAAVSPLFGGRALKGPAAEVLAGLGLEASNTGILEAYRGLLSDLIIDRGDASDLPSLATTSTRVAAIDTRIGKGAEATRFAISFLDTVLAAAGLPVR
jgi:LPPG:FO 2-phospho-L-lactate transferase